MNPAPRFLSVGGGLAGLTAAVRAQELGLAAVVLEAGSGPHYPCNSRIAGGILHVSYQDVRLPTEQLRAGMRDQDVADSPQAEAIAETAPRAFDWLRRHGVKMANFPQLKRGAWVMAPPRPMVTGLQPAANWRGRGPDLTLQTLRARLLALGGQFIEGARAHELIQAEGRCAGVVASRAGEELRLAAAATLLADGGFAADPGCFREFIGPNPDEVVQRNAGSNRGDALAMARAMGAGLHGTDSFYGHVLSRDALHNPALWPYPQVDALGAAGVIVDGNGRRLFDEGLGGIHAANQLARLDHPASAQVIIDAAIWNGPGRVGLVAPNPMLPYHGGTLHQAGDLETLAALAGLPAPELVETVRQYNAALAAGTLTALTPPRSQRKAPALPIQTPPFMAIPVCSGITNTMGGIHIDGHGRVLSADGGVVPGLYAAGAATGGLEGGPTVSYVGGLIKAVVFGMRAAEDAAHRVVSHHPEENRHAIPQS